VLRKVDGTELDIVNAARVSFHKESEWDYQDGKASNNTLSDKDQKLIDYLAKHGHWTPFGHVNATFVIKAPIFVARQLGKHQVGLVWNEVSRRYVDEEPEFFFPDEWRGRPVNAKQGSDGIIKEDTYGELYGDYFDSYEAVNICLSWYKNNIEQGMAPEQARMILPQNMMTEWWWTGSLAAFARVFNLRLDPHTQKETQDVCQMMYDLLLPNFPNALKALME
jgi:thymidylate synthase (FAD)